MSTITNFDGVVNPSANSVVWIVTWPFGTASDHYITLQNLFGNISCDVYTVGNLRSDGNTTLQTVTSNNLTSNTITTSELIVNSDAIVLSNQFTPANSSISEITTGSIFYDDNFGYIAVSPGVIKRFSLETF